MKIAVIGSGTMGRGIAQIFAMFGNKVRLIDIDRDNLKSAEVFIQKILVRLQEKEKIANAQDVLELITYSDSLDSIEINSDIVIEAVVESLEVKQILFKTLEKQVNKQVILATNTSSISVTSVASACEYPSRVLGIHFFNPAPLMPLVEIVEALQTDRVYLERSKQIVEALDKFAVVVKDTPGFIVNRIARPFYSEALKMYEEGVANIPTIDYAMTNFGDFRMGPFELMDYIGNDVNYAVTETVFKSFYYDPRYRPSITQLRYKEAGWYGKKSNKGFYDYENSETLESKINTDEELGMYILDRILVLLFNEAIDALFLKVADYQDIETAMKKGVNYPKGLLKWAEEYGYKKIHNRLTQLQLSFGDTRYRPSVLLKKLAEKNEPS